MAKARRLDAKLTRVRGLRNQPVTPAVIVELRELLADSSNLVVAEAAELVREPAHAALEPDLMAAFPRFLVDPVETDKLCRAKIAITDALNRLEADAEEVYRAGLRHVQPEPCWGGSEDTAAPLRAAAAFALVRMNPRDLMVLLADLLADPEKVARSAAAKALGACATQAAILLLRFKAKVGDKEPEVVVDCLTALMQAAPGEAMPFVGGFLDSPIEEIAEGAALALGESRRPDAFELLRAAWPRARRRESLGNVLQLAVAITRQPAAVDFLLEVLAGPGDAATGALSALAIHRHNPSVRDRVAAVVDKKVALRKAFEKAFDQPPK
jgi:hypothetical protein